MAFKKAVLLLILLSFATFASVSLASATDTTVSILANQDSYIDADAYDSNYGSSTLLQVKSYDGEQQRILMQFDLSSIPSDALVSSATLKLYYAQHLGGSAQSPAGRTYWAYRVTQSWTELGVTWNTYDGTNSWANTGSDYTTADGASLTMPSSLPLWVQWDVTDIVTAWVEDGQPNYGFLIRDADETQNEQEYTPGFRSREYTIQADKKPILEITYTVPEYKIIQPSSQDAYISEWSSSTNNGDSNSLLVYGRDGYAFRTLVQFDLSSIPLGSTVSSAELRLYCYNIVPVYGVDGGSSDRTYRAYRVTQSWTEMGVSWDYYADPNAWANPGGDYTENGASSSIAPSSGGVWMSWTVTDIVKAWIEDGEPNYGFLIKDLAETETNMQHNFWSREYTDDDALRPMLEIAYTPPAPTIESCDSSGTTKNEFKPGDDVYVVGSGYTSSLNNDLNSMNDVVRIPIYALKIVSDVDWTDGMTIPSSIVETTLSPDSSGNIVPTLVWSGAAPGAYDIIVDVNGNGEYDEGVDALDDFDVETAGFFVIPEFLLGTVMGLATLFAAFGTYYMSKRIRIYH